ncbi:hypothetical protein RF11_00902 [Thelohanellus kitauei]|uniref:Uncharacterized protein n=1 Tax=Thelohanellus kitauei TaxID=669202 RepID=A0A0C2MEJ4_THEKT|nr:hypothetical protein RF11_00902 [Thelohanellus kitauei]
MLVYYGYYNPESDRDRSIIAQLFQGAQHYEDLDNPEFIFNRCIYLTASWHSPVPVIDPWFLSLATQLALVDCNDVKASIIYCIEVDFRHRAQSAPPPLPQQLPRDSVKIGKRAAAPISPPTVAPMPLTPPPFNHDRTWLLCATDAVVNVKTSKHRKIPQVKFEKWVGQGKGESGKSITSFRSSV